MFSEDVPTYQKKGAALGLLFWVGHLPGRVWSGGCLEKIFKIKCSKSCYYAISGLQMAFHDNVSSILLLDTIYSITYPILIATKLLGLQSNIHIIFFTILVQKFLKHNLFFIPRSCLRIYIKIVICDKECN